MTQTTQNLLNVIADRKNKQRDVAAEYRKAFNTIPDVDWRKINSAIVERWSGAGLKRVKTMAWQGV